jgi:PadR family transcriptional regulator, regulatory protein PadR
MMRRSMLSERILKVLAEEPARWRHGYYLMKAAGLASGTLYPLLMRLRDTGLVESKWQEPAAPGRPARHAYRITTAGMEAVSEARRPAASGSVGGLESPAT